MKISTRMFNYNEKKWLFEKWKEILNTDNTTTYYSESEKLIILIEKVESKVGWSTQKDIIELDWNLFVIYYDVKNNLIHINETDQGKGNRLINAMFSNNKKIQGDTVFKSLAGVNRLMIGTLGLRNELPGKVSYRMFAGTDVAEGVANAVRGISTKSNLFGNGFNGNGKVSIGCSYKGKIWSKWVESIKYWKSWCDDISMKIKDNDISTENILEGSLKGNEITSFPKGILYKAELANELELENSSKKGFSVGSSTHVIPFSECEITINNEKSNEDEIMLILKLQDYKIELQYILRDNYFEIRQTSKKKIYYVSGKDKITLDEYFEQEPPKVWILGKGKIYSLETNIQIELNGPTNGKLRDDQITKINWAELNVNIKRESQGKYKDSTSIQYTMINKVLKKEDYQIIFDDDGTGEVADIVAIKEIDDVIEFDFFHCKYSEEKNPGARVSDLYEVCGQTEKSLRWASDYIALLERLIEREVRFKKKNNSFSRLEKGTLNDLNTIKNKLKSGKKAKINMNIVQPGVKRESISKEMNIVLLGCEAYLRDTYGSNLTLYCS